MKHVVCVRSQAVEFETWIFWSDKNKHENIEGFIKNEPVFSHCDFSACASEFFIITLELIVRYKSIEIILSLQIGYSMLWNCITICFLFKWMRQKVYFQNKMINTIMPVAMQAIWWCLQQIDMKWYWTVLELPCILFHVARRRWSWTYGLIEFFDVATAQTIDFRDLILIICEISENLNKQNSFRWHRIPAITQKNCENSEAAVQVVYACHGKCLRVYSHMWCLSR